MARAGNVKQGKGARERLRKEARPVSVFGISWVSAAPAAAALAVALIKPLTVADVAAVLEVLAFWLSWLLAGCAAANTLHRAVTGDWAFSSARGPLFAGVLVASGLISLAELEMQMNLEGLPVCGGGVALLIGWLVVEPLIKTAVSSEGGSTGTARVRGTLIRGSSVGDLVEMWCGSWVGRFLSRLLRDPGKRALSPLKTFVANGLVLLVAAQGALALGERAAAVTRASGKQQAPIRVRQPPRPSRLPRQLPTPSSAESWGDVCGPDAPLPGVGAPPWATWRLYGLFLGHGGPGATGAGCTTHPYRPVVGNDGFVAQVGYGSDGRIRSVAVTSREFGSAIFIAPAAKLVLRTMARVGALGGSRRISVGIGDLYLVQDRYGSEVLVREKTVAAAGDYAEPYVDLPEPVAAVWLLAMRRYGGWLWPETRSRHGHIGRFALVHDPATHDTVDFLTFDRVAHLATLVHAGSVVATARHGVHITEHEIRGLISSRP